MNLENAYILDKLRGDAHAVSLCIDWKELLLTLNRHKLLPFLYEKIKKDIPECYSALYEEHFALAVTRQDKLWDFFVEFSKLAEEENLKIILPKGFPLAYELYGNINLRVSGDIDMLVHKQDIGKLCELLCKSGAFHRHNGNIEEVVKRFLTNEFDNFYELKFVKSYKGELLWLEVKKATDAIPEMYIEEFIDTAEITTINGYDVWRLEYAHMFVHLCANAHKDTNEHEGICTDVFRMRNFIDIYQFLIKKGDQLDWRQVEDIGTRCKIKHKIIWALKALMELLPEVSDNSSFKTGCEKMGIEFVTYESNRTYRNNTNFSELFFDNELARLEYQDMIYDKRWNDNNPNLRDPVVLNENVWFSLPTKDEMLYSLFYSKGKIGIKLRASGKKNLIDLLGTDRLYFSFIGKERVNTVDVDTIGKPSEGVLLFTDNGNLVMKRGEHSIWSVNYGSLRNDQISETKIVKENTECNEYEVEVDVANLIINSNLLAYNIWIDGPVLKDYYRHKWYQYSLDEDFGVLMFNKEEI